MDNSTHAKSAHPLDNEAFDSKPACKPAGRPRASDVEARAQQLVMTAAHLFLKNGYSNVSLETIAREAHVAVRTIYVKFGGKAGLLKAAIDANRERFYSQHDLENDQRPLRVSVAEFAHHFFDMITAPAAVGMKRMVIAEARTNPELLETFMASGPQQSRAMLLRYFSRPEIRAQMRDDTPVEQLPHFLLNAIMGDPFTHLVYPDDASVERFRATLPARVELFLRAIEKP